MSWETLLTFNLVLGASILAPGAAFLMALKTTLTSGRKAGILTGIGLAMMASCLTLAALLGLEAVFALFPWAYSALKLLGAGYLIWIAVQTWRAAHAPLAERDIQLGRAFWGGVLVNLGNPKSVLFAASVLVVIFPQHMAPGHIALIVANHFLLEILFYTMLAMALSTPAVSARYLRTKPVFDRIAAGLLGLLGLRLLLNR